MRVIVICASVVCIPMGVFAYLLGTLGPSDHTCSHGTVLIAIGIVLLLLPCGWLVLAWYFADARRHHAFPTIHLRPVQVAERSKAPEPASATYPVLIQEEPVPTDA